MWPGCVRHGETRGRPGGLPQDLFQVLGLQEDTEVRHGSNLVGVQILCSKKKPAFMLFFYAHQLYLLSFEKKLKNNALKICNYAFVMGLLRFAAMLCLAGETRRRQAR